MKYTIEFYCKKELAAEGTIDAPGEVECKAKVYPDYPPVGVKVEISKAEEDLDEATVEFSLFEDRTSFTECIPLKNGHGATFYDTDYHYGLQVVIRPFGS